MTRILKFIGKLVIVVLAIFAVVILVSGYTGSFRWAQAVQPFVHGSLSATGKVVREELTTRSEQQMEKDGEFLGRRLYPVEKGFLKGQLEALKADPNKEELRKTIRDLTHEMSKEFVAPVTEGVAETSKKVLQDVGNVLQELQKTLKDIPAPPAPEPPPAN